MSTDSIKSITGKPLTLNEEMLSPSQAAKFCNISRGTLYNKVNQYCFPEKHNINGNKKGFLKSDLELWKELGELTFKLHFGEQLKLAIKNKQAT